MTDYSEKTEEKPKDRTKSPSKEDLFDIVPATGKLGKDELFKLFKSMWQTWRPRRELDEIVRDRVYRRRVPSSVGPNGEGNALRDVPVKSGVTGTLLREFIGILGSDTPHFHAIPDGLGPLSNQDAELIEEWDESWWYSAGGDEEKQNLIDGDQLAFGRGVSYVAWARQFLMGMPERDGPEPGEKYKARVQEFLRKVPNPLLWSHCPSPQTMFDEDEWQAEYGQPNVFYWQHRRRSEISAQYPDSQIRTKDREDKSEGDPWVLFLCWANRRYMAYMACESAAASDPATESRPVSVIRNQPDKWELLVPPFEHGIKGNPFCIQLGDVRSDPEIQFRYSGVFDNSIELVDRVDDALTQYGTAVRRYARAQPVIMRSWGPAGEAPYGIDKDDGSITQHVWDPDNILEFGPGETPGWWKQDMKEHESAVSYLNILSQYIQRDTMAPSAVGSGSGMESGYQLTTFIQASERKLLPMIKRKARATERLLENVHQLVEYIGVDMAVKRTLGEDGFGGGSTAPAGGWVTLPKRLASKARVRVKLNPRLDAQDASKAQIAIQLGTAVSNGWLDIDKDWIMERWLNLENPERHRKAALLQQFLKNPEIQNWVMQQVLKVAQMQLSKDQVDMVKVLSAFSPADLMLIPKALQMVLKERGMIAPDDPSQVGATHSDGGSGLNAVLSASGAPSPVAAGASGGPGIGDPSGPAAAAMGAGAGAPGGTGPMGGAQSLATSGQPRGPGEAGL